MISCGNQWRTYLHASVSYVQTAVTIWQCFVYSAFAIQVIGFGVYWRYVDILNQEAKLTNVYDHKNAALVY